MPVRCPPVTFQVKSSVCFPSVIEKKKNHPLAGPKGFWAPPVLSLPAHPGGAFSSFACCCFQMLVSCPASFVPSAGVLTPGRGRKLLVWLLLTQ